MKEIAVLLIISFLFSGLSSGICKGKKGPSIKLHKKKVKTKVIYKKKTSFDFSGDNIEGDYKKPEGFHMVHRASSSFKEIIKFNLRFKDSVKKSVGFLE